MALHQITNPKDADFTITSPSTLESTASSVNDALTILLAGIAAISLLVGGIGVMNVVLVSVTERVREIAELRKALGATPAAIRRQFLFEATTLGLTGGFLGAGVGVLGAVVIPDLALKNLHRYRVVGRGRIDSRGDGDRTRLRRLSGGARRPAGAHRRAAK